VSRAALALTTENTIVTVERSHGKARPTLVRASDLAAVETDNTRPSNHGPGGHFTPGNTAAKDGRFRATVKKALGNRADKGEVGVVASDARRVHGHILRAMPSDAAPVRVLAAIHARHVALNAYFTAKAEAAGLDTPAGMKLLDVAGRESQRAERTLVTLHDLARVHAVHDAKSRGPVDPLAGFYKPADVETEAADGSE
jgi:hypothetical protein